MSKPVRRSPPRVQLGLLAVALLFTVLGGACAWLCVQAIAHGVIEVRHGPVVRARDPALFALEFTIRAASTAVLLPVAGWLAWVAGVAPPRALRGRTKPRR